MNFLYTLFMLFSAFITVIILHFIFKNFNIPKALKNKFKISFKIFLLLFIITIILSSFLIELFVKFNIPKLYAFFISGIFLGIMIKFLDKLVQYNYSFRKRKK